MADVDDNFYERADAHIHLSNAQAKDAKRGQVSASMLYGTSRFNAWVTACGSDSKAGMQASREEAIEYFVEQYRHMLIENLDDYIEHFDRYMKPTRSEEH